MSTAAGSAWPVSAACPDLTNLILQAMFAAMQSKHDGLVVAVHMAQWLAIIHSAVDPLWPIQRV